LSAGTHRGQVTISANGARGSPKVISVTLQITSPSSQCGRVIYTDDFSDPNSGWSVGSSSGGFNWGYTDDGEYRVLTGSSFFIAWSWAPFSAGRIPRDFCLEADVKQHVAGSLSDHGEIGLIFAGNPDARSFIRFGIISPDGTYQIRRLSSGGTYETTVSPTRSSAIRPVNHFNHLLIVARGNRASFYINDVLVKTLTIETAGAVGVFARTFEEPNVNGRFDNFTVRELR
jgi:hypothetical protein